MVFSLEFQVKIIKSIKYGNSLKYKNLYLGFYFVLYFVILVLNYFDYAMKHQLNYNLS